MSEVNVARILPPLGNEDERTVREAAEPFQILGMAPLEQFLCEFSDENRIVQQGVLVRLPGAGGAADEWRLAPNSTEWVKSMGRLPKKMQKAANERFAKYQAAKRQTVAAPQAGELALAGAVNITAPKAE